MASTLEDSFGRRFSYLRLSLTDACNFRCVYCLPNGYKKNPAEEDVLSLSEIRHLGQAFAEMGTKKIRLTGGEPTLRNDILDISRTLRDIPGIEQVALSTNGFRLKELAPKLREAGISSVNVSLDTLDETKFREITGSRQLSHILEGIEALLEAGFPLVKINAVLMKDWNSTDLESFLQWIRHKPLVVRFIELMRTGDNKALFEARHVSASQMRDYLLKTGWNKKNRSDVDGPAEEFTHSDYQGRMGLIAPYAKDFCATCNRLRVTSRGGLRLCLFGEGNHSLRDLLQHPSQKEELKMRLRTLLQRKEVSHYLPEGKYGNNNSFSAMGG